MRFLFTRESWGWGIVSRESRVPDMKLALLLFDYFPYGGLQRGCFMVAEEAARRGHTINIFTSTWTGDRPRGAEVGVLGRGGWSNIGRNKSFFSRWQARRSGTTFDGVIGFNKMPGLDIYYASDSCYAARIQRLKPVWYRWLSRYRHFHAWEEAVFRRGGATHVLALAETEIPLYRQHYDTEAERFHLLPPGIVRRTESDADQARIRETFRAASGWKSEDKILLLVGSGFRTKGLDRAIRGLEALSPALREKTRLVVVGDDRADGYRWLAGRHDVGDRVEFAGGRPNVYEYLCAADLLVHPAYAENTGNVLLEAMTAGLPVLASGTCGFAGHVQKAGAGKIVGSNESFSQEEFNRVLTEMLSSKNRGEWSRGGLNYAATADLYSRREKAVDLIERLVSRK